MSSVRGLLREIGCLYPCPFLPTVEGRMGRTEAELGTGTSLNTNLCSVYTLDPESINKDPEQFGSYHLYFCVVNKLWML